MDSDELFCAAHPGVSATHRAPRRRAANGPPSPGWLLLCTPCAAKLIVDHICSPGDPEVELVSTHG